MKKFYSTASVIMLSSFLIGCGSKPMTEGDMAKKYGLTAEEYQEQKEAAARMNMSVEDHLKHGHHDETEENHTDHHHHH